MLPAAASGWNDANAGHVIDIHDYNGMNAAKPNGTRASVSHPALAQLPEQPGITALQIVFMVLTLGLRTPDSRYNLM